MAEAACSSCHQARTQTSPVCVMCQVPLCPACVQYQFPNRCGAAVCRACAVPEDLPFECGRCHGSIACDAMEFFCDMCADPICFSCIDASFEGGELKCAACCPESVRFQLRQAGVGNFVSTALLSYFEKPISPAHQQQQQQPLASSQLFSSPQSRSLSHASKYMTLKRKRKLGEGAQGAVYQCEAPDGEVVVSKEMLFDDVDVSALESQRKQAERMMQLNHEHLIRYLDVIPRCNPSRLCVIMPYYSEGDLRQFIERQRLPVREEKLCSIVLQIAGSLRYLHTQSPPLIHLDVKPENILLLNNEEQVLLMDLDLCRSVDVSASVIKRANEPTYEYSAPELMGSTGTPKADVFSLGVVTYVLATFPDIPSSRNDQGEHTMLCDRSWTRSSLERAVKRDLARVPNYRYSDGFEQLLVRMLAPKPEERLSSSEVITMLTRLMEQNLLRA